MKNSHPTADGFARHAQVPWTARLFVFILLVAAAMGGFGARAALADIPTVVLSFDQTSIPTSGHVLMTATVTSAVGTPNGTVTFFDRSPGGVAIGTLTLLPTVDPKSMSKQLDAVLAARPYSIVAMYAPDFGIGIDSAESAPQTIGPPRGTPKHATQVTLSAPSPTVVSGVPVTLTATVSAGIGNGTPTGTVTFSDVTNPTNPVPLGGGAQYLLANGAAQITVPDFSVGPHEVVANYSGDSANEGSPSLPLHLDSQPAIDPRVTTITDVAVTRTTVAAGDVVTIIATVVQVTPTGAIRASGGRVDFRATLANSLSVSLGSADLGTAPAGSQIVPASNQAVLESSSLVVAGDYTINASYSFGSVFISDTPGATSISVLPMRASPTVTYTGDLGVVFGHTANVSATIKDHSGSALPNRIVTFRLGSQTCEGTTGADGKASCVINAVAHHPGATVVTVELAQDLQTAHVSKDFDFSVTAAPTSISVATYSGATSGEYHDYVLLSGSLADTAGVPFTGQALALTFTVGTQTCTGFPIGNKAYCLLLLTQPAGTYTVSVSYAGNATYAPTTTSTPFTISREDTTLVAQVGDALINGNSVSLSAVLLEDNLFPIAGRTVTLKLGTASCTATTSATGAATCTVPRTSILGPTTFTANFLGDAYYLPSSTSRSTVVCSFPTGGSFVIGDRDDDTSVNFWGSQWSKQNKLSHGDAPSSFKGWSSGSFDANWGTSDWSSDTGSSGMPPSTLPTYMAVIQIGSSRKSGSRISGDTMHIVVVKTNAGYAPNAGHDGTGTIVATVR